ncbi:MAG TPA: M56 family metallopeptidase [Candidatus Baltobacteraceae bacterium]|nr:M56 family metallopeptidase [Candidatus Baltobacteraceae bacterium]
MNAAQLLTALFNGAWQGTLLCGCALLAFRMFRRLNATTMFALWSGLLIICLALPLMNLAFAPKPYTIHVTPVQVRRQLEKPVQLPRERPAIRADVRNEAAAPAVMRAQEQPTVQERAAAFADALFARAWILLFVLAALAGLRVLILIREVIRMLRARRRVRFIEAPLSLNGACPRPFRFAASDEFTSPCVLGFAPPLIVLPDDVLGAGEEQLLSIVLHEREHVRRFDDVQNVVARFAGAVAFFCPGVRIALRELALYREQICDDAAINGTGDRISYAMTLTDMAQWAQGRGAPVPSLIFKRKQLLHRLEVLLDSAVSHSLRINRRFALTAASVIAIAALLVARVQVPVVAEIIAPVPQPAPVPKLHIVAPVKMVAPRIAPTVTQRPIPNLKVQPARAGVAHLQKIAAPKPAPASVIRVTAPAQILALAAAPRVAQVSGSAMVIAQNGAPARPDDLLDALNAAGLRNLSVDQLIALRDHGVSTRLIQASVSYFGPHVDAQWLTYMADHGISPGYLQELSFAGIHGITPESVVLLQDHGVSAELVRAAMSYFTPAPSASDLAKLADHGVSTNCIAGFRSAGLYGVGIDDAIRLLDHGVSGSYVMKVRRLNPHASIDDIIRLHDNGF